MKDMPFVRFCLRCIAVTTEPQEALDAHNLRRSNEAKNQCSEEAYKPQNLIPCFLMIIVGANMQRDASCSEFRLRDDTCVVQAGPHGQRSARVNAAHFVLDILPKVHQIRTEWPHTCSEIWPAQLCAPGEEHYGSSLTDFVVEGEKKGKFKRLAPKGATVFKDPDESVMVRDVGPSSSAMPMPGIPKPTLDDEMHGAVWAV